MLNQELRQQSRQGGLTTGLARTPHEIEEAQRLRYKVFAEEMGARLSPGGDGLDQDVFDPYCEHLLVRNDEGKVIGTYRILAPGQARSAGGYYSETEFDLTRLMHLRDRMVEVGRSCVHRDYRAGPAIARLWGGLANYMRQSGCEYLIGCASISMGDGGHYAASVYNKVCRQHAAPVEYRVFPRCPLPLERLDGSLDVDVPPLIKGYLRLGAYVCGEPAWDPDFNTADVFILLPLARLDTRYARRLTR